jgi:membrane carboxypeptidase/penicillin-binding protein PbpC
MIELTATLGGDVRWFINGQPLPTQRDGRTFWPLTPGEWKIRAVTDRATIEQHVAVE